MTTFNIIPLLHDTDYIIIAYDYIIHFELSGLSIHCSTKQISESYVHQLLHKWQDMPYEYILLKFDSQACHSRYNTDSKMHKRHAAIHPMMRVLI
jgi:hypothetical protein